MGNVLSQYHGLQSGFAAGELPGSSSLCGMLFQGSVERRLATWKSVCLPLGGKVTLIQAMLSNLLVYYMSLLKCPMSVENMLEKLGRDFLSQGRES